MRSHEFHHWLLELWACVLATDWSIPSPKISFLCSCLTGSCSLFLGMHLSCIITALLHSFSANYKYCPFKENKEKFLESSWLLSLLWDLVFRYCFSIQRKCLIYRQFVYTPINVVILCSWHFGLFFFLLKNSYCLSGKFPCFVQDAKKQLGPFEVAIRTLLNVLFWFWSLI